MMTDKNKISLRTILMIGLSVLYVGFLFPQTAPNTHILNEAKATYKFRSYPTDSIQSNVVLFSVLDAPNFEISFGTTNSFVFAKETVIVRLVYTNVGNQKADTATIEGILPPAGLRFVPGSTKGTISGSTVSWTVYNIQPNQSDSVAVKAVVDSTLAGNTQLQFNGNINWHSSSKNALHTFTVSSFPRLGIALSSTASHVGSGRTMTYQISVKNTGNIPATSTILYDTISSLGTFVSSSITPDSISSDKRLVKWNLGSISAFSERTISVVVLTPSNLISGNLKNSVFTFASNVSQSQSASSSMQIVPIVPKKISITPTPQFIFGKVGMDSSRIAVVLRDSLDEILPDGVPVQFQTSHGSYSNNSTSMSATIQNGSALVTLKPENVINEILRTKITAIGGSANSGAIEDTANVFIYPGAVTGVVVNGINRVPFQGAFAIVYNSSNMIIGRDTTKSDGRFFIPLNKDITAYNLEIIVIDKFGDTVKTRTQIDPSDFPLPPLEIPNIISGRIEYKVSGDPVPAPGVTIFLDSLFQQPIVSPRNARNIRNLRTQTSLIRVQEQKTDEKGKFKFENLSPAQYVISLDSVEFPNFTGFAFLTDTASGTFTINLSLQIALDSTITFTPIAPLIANAKDTIKIGFVLNNSGNTEHRNVSIVDTLPPFVSYISTQLNSFNSVMYDSTTRIISIAKDTLHVLEKDSVHISLLIAKNVPDSTKLNHRFWLSSSSINANISKTTTVRSLALLEFSNSFVLSKDSIVAGDSIRHVFRFKNSGTDSLRGIRIVDTLFSAGFSGISLAKSSLDSTKFIDSVSIVYIGAIPPEKEDSVSIKLLTDFGLRNGSSLTSHAYVMKGDSVLARRDTTLLINENPNLSGFLKIVKSGNKKVAEIGDIVTYQIQILNSSPQLLKQLGVYDLLPYAFKYVKNSARFNGKPIEPTINAALNQLVWNVNDTILSNKNAQLVYQLAIGADALESEGLNTAFASAVSGLGTPLVSAASQWQVTVRPGVFTDKGLIIGKVFYDDNRNTFQDAGEHGLKNVELWMEDGTKIITGDDGKFSLPEVKPGQHVLRINENSLPKNTELLLGNNAFAKDPSSRFVRVTDGGIAKANFYIKRAIKDSVHNTIAKLNKLISARQVKPKYIFSDTLRKIGIDTIEMFVTFAYSGSQNLESVDIYDILSEKFTVVPNSASFNGKRINPIISGSMIQWRLGKINEIANGVLKYKAYVKDMPNDRTVLQSVSVIRTISSDSVMLDSETMVTDNVVIDTLKNKIETSEIIHKHITHLQIKTMSELTTLTVDDDVFFKTTIFIDPNKKIKSIQLVDTIGSVFLINERSFTVNGIPIPSKNLSLALRSQSLSAAKRPLRNEVEMMRIASINITDLFRAGINEISYSATLQSAPKDTFYKRINYVIVKNEFGEEYGIKGNETRINIKRQSAASNIILESKYTDLPRSVIETVEEKVVEATKLIESLKENTGRAVVMDGITFELSKATLTNDSKTVLDNIAKLLKDNPGLNLEINGYTDNTGNAGANRIMSLNRAKEVRDYLVSQGIEPKRLRAQGFGPSNPIASNKTEEGRSKNRRVEFARMK